MYNWISGGVDSTYTALKVKEMGFNPLAVHLDNGWNSELATHNIQKMLDILNIDYIRMSLIGLNLKLATIFLKSFNS